MDAVPAKMMHRKKLFPGLDFNQAAELDKVGLSWIKQLAIKWSGLVLSS